MKLAPRFTLLMIALAALTTLFAGRAQAQQPFPGNDEPTGPNLLVQAKPRLVVEKIQHDFGRIMDTASVFVDIPFKNTGTGKLEITDTHATCGCTVGRLEQTSYEPGQSGILKVEFKPQGKNGSQLQRVTIRSNDPVQPEVTVSITAEVEPVVIVEPKLIQFGEIKKGEGRTAMVKIYGRTDDFAATFGTVSDDSMTLKVLETRPVELNGKTLRATEVLLTLKEGAQVGHLQQSASIRTNDPRMPAVTVQIMGDIVGDLEAGPARLALGVLQLGGPIKSEFKITSRAGTAFKVGSVELQSVNDKIKLDFQVKPVDPAQPNSYTIEVTGKAPDEAVPIRGEVVIKTDVKGEETVRIPFFGVVRPQNLGAAK